MPTVYEDPIQHVVVLMLENRSFDQMLGAFQRVYPELDGVPNDGKPRSNPATGGRRIAQLPNAARFVELDPHHDLASVLRQIGAPAARRGPDPRGSSWRRVIRAVKNSDPIGWAKDLIRARKKRTLASRSMMSEPFEGHFVEEYIRSYPQSTPEQRQQVMSYFDVGTLPALHELANHFTICDRWFSSLPGPTWANRFFTHSGTSLGTTWMPEKASDLRGTSLFDQETLYDRLTAGKRSWRIYFHDFPQSLAMSRLWTRESRRNFSTIDVFEHDTQSDAANFPDFTFIEPQYMGEDANDDHPPHDTLLAQKLIARIYNAIRSNDSLWATTLLVITYDEHGGFYDHVEPPDAVCPDGHQADWNFEKLGVRVPALLVSPWVKRGPWSEQLDHTSIGKYVCEKWKIAPLGKRMEQAASLAGAILGGQTMRDDTPSRIGDQFEFAMAGQLVDARTMSDNQRAIKALADRLAPQFASKSHLPRGGYGALSAKPSPEELRRQAMSFLNSD